MVRTRRIETLHRQRAQPHADARPLADKHHATYVAGINGKLDEKDQPPIADLMKIVGVPASPQTTTRPSHGAPAGQDPP